MTIDELYRRAYMWNRILMRLGFEQEVMLDTLKHPANTRGWTDEDWYLWGRRMGRLNRLVRMCIDRSDYWLHQASVQRQLRGQS